MSRPLCIYHKNCLDGNGAAAVVERKVSDCDFLSMQYGQTPPTVLDREVYIVDFGLSVEHMRALRAQATRVTWIDHHASQLPVHQQLGWGILDVNECGSSLAWKTLFPNDPMPEVISYIKDKDLWQWRLPDSRAIVAGLSARFPGDRFTGLLEADLGEMAEIGRPLVAATAERVNKTLTQGIAVEAPYGLIGKRAFVVPCNQDQNEVGDQICLPPEQGGLGFDLAILVYRKGNGRWVHSLRSANDGTVNCAKIADARSGGGHPQSACYLNSVHFLDSSDCPPAFRRLVQ